MNRNSGRERGKKRLNELAQAQPVLQIDLTSARHRRKALDAPEAGGLLE